MLQTLLVGEGYSRVCNLTNSANREGNNREESSANVIYSFKDLSCQYLRGI